MKILISCLICLTGVVCFGQTLIFERKPLVNDSIEVKIIEYDSVISEFSLAFPEKSVLLTNENPIGIISVSETTKKAIVIACDAKNGFVLLPFPEMESNDTLLFSELYLIPNNFPMYVKHIKECWKVRGEKRTWKSGYEIYPLTMNRDTVVNWQILINANDTSINLYPVGTSFKHTIYHGYKNYRWYKFRRLIYRNEPRNYIKTYEHISEGTYNWRNRI
ncbi:hypothetical protein KFE94_16435 [bacterium SCSIO 12643]|nr:hypothetical protein KFE94_16435 [bacterium SCSIO 12643]